MSGTGLKLTLCLLLTIAPLLSKSAPMGFKDSWMMMGDYSAEFQELTLNKAISSRDALGVTGVRMRADQERWLYNNELTYTRLVKRWNLPNAQANVWFFGGVGETYGTGLANARLTVSPGLQLDYETRRLYGSVNARTYRGEGVNHSLLSTRAGFSFYEVDYDQVQPWFILEARHMSFISNDIEITPMLRMIHKSFFVEAGANTSGKPRLNFMYIF